MKSNDWYKKVLLKNAKEIVSDGTTYVILALVLLLWHFALGIKFEWQHIAPLSEPSVFVRAFYSAFTFCTLGLLLYVLRFYKVLHDIVVKAFGMWELYNLIKAGRITKATGLEVSPNAKALEMNLKGIFIKT